MMERLLMVLDDMDDWLSVARHLLVSLVAI